MKPARDAFGLAAAVAALSAAACSTLDGSAEGTLSGARNVAELGGAHGPTGSVGMRLTLGNNLHIDSLDWSISNGMLTYTGVVDITDDAGHEAQSIALVAGNIQTGSGYVVSLSGSDSNGDPCTGSSAPVSVAPNATSTALVVVTCTVPTHQALSTSVDGGFVAVDAGVVLVEQPPFECPGITGVSISPAEVLPPQTAALGAHVTGSMGGVQTLNWTTDCAGASFADPTAATTSFSCGSTPGGTLCTVTLTLGLDGTGADGGSVGEVCAGVANGTTATLANRQLAVFCENGG